MFRFPLFLLLSGHLLAFSPRFHEAQTRLAVNLVPQGMARFLKTHPEALVQGARGGSSDQAPTVEDVETQFHRVARLSEEGRRREEIVRELGVLGRMVQLLADPSTLRGITPLRELYQRFGDEKLARLVLTREPYWATQGSRDPRPALLALAKRKFERFESLQSFADPLTGQRVGTWDELSIPSAQLLLSFNDGVHATANLWILLWRAEGELWQ